MTNGPEQNIRLGALPQAERERLFPHLEHVDLALGAVLYDPGEHMHHAYLPVDCIVAALRDGNGESAEISVIGNEGLVGIALFMGGQTMPNRAVVQSPGRAYRLDEKLLKSEFNRHGALHSLFLRYTQSLVTQMAQTAVCNRHPSVVQQLCR